MADERSAGLTDSITINAGMDAILAVLGDFDSYPEWMSGVEAIEVLKRDRKKRGTEVRFTVDAVVRSISYVLKYSYPKANRIEMSLVEGDLEDCNSYYEFEDLSDGRTRVTYHYDVRYSLPRVLLNPVTRRLLKTVDKKVMNSALGDLKKRAESG